MANIYITSHSDMNIFSNYRQEHGPLKLYRVLDLRSGEYLNNYTFISEQSAKTYLEAYIKKQWEMYKDIITKNKYIIPCDLNNYMGDKIKQPTDREYMFDIVEVKN